LFTGLDDKLNSHCMISTTPGSGSSSATAMNSGNLDDLRKNSRPAPSVPSDSSTKDFTSVCRRANCTA
jgi:hypothetical protein